MEHNERNIRQTNIASPKQRLIGVNGEDNIPDSGDEGTIRYRIDEDLQVNVLQGSSNAYWSRINDADTGARYNSYSSPFTFNSLKYRDDLTPVVGSTGPNQVDITDRENVYYYGLLDEFGDEWHTLVYADDDAFLYDNPDGPWIGPHFEKLASDGKTVLFVVNPKTPLISFSNLTGQAQFYTTPAKAYNIPKVHNQTTYLTDDVEIKLVNIMGGEISYRFGNDDFQPYTGPINSNSLSDGENILEYYYNENNKKTRKIVKNPTYPSADELHGNMMWRSQEEFNAIKLRLENGRYNFWYDLLKARGTGGNDRNQMDYWDTYSAKGYRVDTETALMNAFIAAVEGLDYINSGSPKSHAAYAKEMLLENVLNLDPLWFGDHTSTPDPSHEILYRGYYDVMPVISNALAYDLLIGSYRQDLINGGITPIEDYKIRDSLAKWNIITMMHVGLFGRYGAQTNSLGMWPQARGYGVLINAIAMPTYNTPYYGTSGFDGSIATYEWTPFKDYPRTWKDVYFDPVATTPQEIHEFPNQAQPADIASGGDYRGHLIVTESENGNIANGYVISEGDWLDRPVYLGLYGMPLTIFANILKITQNKAYPHIEKLFKKVADGTCIGVKETPLTYAQVPYFLLVNEYFSGEGPSDLNSVAAKHENYMDSFPEGDINTRDQRMTRCGVYSLILYRDNWRDYVDLI